MKTFINKISILAAGLFLMTACSLYDASELNKVLDEMEQEISSMEQMTQSMNTQLENVRKLMTSRFICYVGEDEKGNKVIRYRDNNLDEKTVVLVTSEQVNTLPILSAGQYTDGKYYWRKTTDNGKTYSWVLHDGNMLEISQAAPEVDIDENGHWTMDGEVVEDADGNPLLANDVSNILFKGIEQDEETGKVVFTLADGTTFEVATFEALDIEFDTAVYTGVPSYSTKLNIKYRVTGSLAKEATVDYFTAWNMSVDINRYTKNISAQMTSGAEEGTIIIVASAGGNSVVKPLFFTYGECVIEKPIWDAKYGSTEITVPGEAGTFDMRVSANIDYDVKISDDASEWLTQVTSKAALTTETLSFATTKYENDLGLDREATITLSNSVYGISVNVKVLQNPVKVERLENGIATPGDLVLFAKAVTTGGDINEFMQNGEVILLNDIDMSPVTTWTPAGNANTGVSSVMTSTNAFKGIFNGKGYTIKGINWTIDAAESESQAIGLFGILDGATVKNLTLGEDGDKIVITGNIDRTMAIGVLSGYVDNNSKIIGVTNNVSLELAGDLAEGKLLAMAGIAGFVRASTIGDSAGESKNKVYNNGNVYHSNPITNTNNGASGLNTAGIIGYSLGNSVYVNHCYNYGNISGSTGRSGGIIATIAGPTTGNLVTFVADCYNYGTIEDDVVNQFEENTAYADVKRNGGIVGGTVTNPYIELNNCYNYGNVFSRIGARTGGFVGHNRATLTGCVNRGTILSTPTLNEEGGQQTGAGWACGYSAADLVTSCACGGRVGSWAEYKDDPTAAPAATMDNAFSYRNAEYFDKNANFE